MKKNILNIILVSLSFSLFNCASSYHPINPSSINYSNTDTKNNLSFSYKYEILEETGNDKYAKHEEKSNIKLLSVKITNNTGKKINIANDISFFAGEKQIFPVEPAVVKHKLSQGVAVYLWYLLLTPIQFSITSHKSSAIQKDTNPVGFVIGPGLCLGNMVLARSSNQTFYMELVEYYINKDLENGQTFCGLVAFNNINFEQISIK